MDSLMIQIRIDSLVLDRAARQHELQQLRAQRGGLVLALVDEEPGARADLQRVSEREALVSREIENIGAAIEEAERRLGDARRAEAAEARQRRREQAASKVEEIVALDHELIAAARAWCNLLRARGRLLDELRELGIHESGPISMVGAVEALPRVLANAGAQDLAPPRWAIPPASGPAASPPLPDLDRQRLAVPPELVWSGFGPKPS